jgi:hypothetical protein
MNSPIRLVFKLDQQITNKSSLTHCVVVSKVTTLKTLTIPKPELCATNFRHIYLQQVTCILNVKFMHSNYGRIHSYSSYGSMYHHFDDTSSTTSLQQKSFVCHLAICLITTTPAGLIHEEQTPRRRSYSTSWNNHMDHTCNAHEPGSCGLHKTTTYNAPYVLESLPIICFLLLR